VIHAESSAPHQPGRPASHSLRVTMRVLLWLIWEDPHLLALFAL
jgi:hypothetical protein